MTKLPREKMPASKAFFIGGTLLWMMKGRGINSRRMSELILKTIWMMQL
jgi:hypothetical protein